VLDRVVVDPSEIRELSDLIVDVFSAALQQELDIVVGEVEQEKSVSVRSEHSCVLLRIGHLHFSLVVLFHRHVSKTWRFDTNRHECEDNKDKDEGRSRRILY
jgi:hypothetical protein